MSSISRFPKAFMNVLGLQTFGETPRELGPIVAPVMEMGDFYLLDSMVAALGSDAAPALGSRSFTTSTLGYLDLSQPVPANEYWFVHEFHISAAPGAATGITVQPRVSASNASLVFVAPMVITGSAGSPVIMAPSMFPRMWLPPGARFSYLCSAITGAPGAVDGVAWVSRYGAGS